MYKKKGVPRVDKSIRDIYVMEKIYSNVNGTIWVTNIPILAIKFYHQFCF